MPTDGGGAGGSNFIGPGLTELANEQGGGASSGSITFTYETEGECGGGQLAGCPACEHQLRRAGLVDGPTFAPLPAAPDCLMQAASFQLAIGLPWIYEAPETLLEESLGYDEAVCADPATTNEWTGDAGIVLRISSGNDSMDGVIVRATALQAGETDCDLRPPYATLTVRNLPPGRTIVFDSAEHSLLEYEDSSGRVVGTTEHIDFGGPIRWLEVPPCGNVCICFDATGATAIDPTNVVIVENVRRSL